MSGILASTDVDPRLLQRLNCPLEEIAKLCEKFEVSELSVFGSAVRDDFKPKSSDIDFLVEFEPKSQPTFQEFFDLSEAMTRLTGRRVDIVPKEGLKEFIRIDVLAESKVIYATQ